MKVLGSITYQKLTEIGKGQGRNSKVYLADEPQLGGQVAVKEIDKANFGTAPADYFQEAKAMYQTGHANVVPIHYACETGSSIALVMPHYPDGSLAKRIEDRPLQPSEVLRVAQAVLAGLAHIHAAGFVHFDVKPSNVLFSMANVPMVADFGQSRPVSPTTGTATVPSLYYASIPPELLTSAVGTALSDIYQAGLLLYRAVNGDELFQAQIPPRSVLEERIRKGKFPDRNQFMPHVPKRLRTIIRKAMRVNPAERYQSATDMADALVHVALPLDWLTEPLATGGYRWTAQRLGRASFVVEMTPQAGTTWDVRMFTEMPGEPRRARNRKENWRSKLSRTDALAHLTAVFRRLSE
jgi:serine/threonine protein kinase